MTQEFIPDPQEVNSGRVFAVLSYFGFLVLVPLLAMRSNRYVNFHTNQGLVLFILEIICSILSFLLSWIPIIRLIPRLLSLCCLILAILGIVDSARGVCKPLPILSMVTLVRY